MSIRVVSPEDSAPGRGVAGRAVDGVAAHRRRRPVRVSLPAGRLGQSLPVRGIALLEKGQAAAAERTIPVVRYAVIHLSCSICHRSLESIPAPDGRWWGSLDSLFALANPPEAAGHLPVFGPYPNPPFHWVCQPCGAHRFSVAPEEGQFSRAPKSPAQITMLDPHFPQVKMPLKRDLRLRSVRWMPPQTGGHLKRSPVPA